MLPHLKELFEGERTFQEHSLFERPQKKTGLHGKYSETDQPTHRVGFWRCLRIRKQYFMITLDKLIATLSIGINSSVLGINSSSLIQKLHGARFLGLKSSKLTTSMWKLVTLYRPSSRSSFSKSSFKVSGSPLISNPPASTT